MEVSIQFAILVPVVVGLVRAVNTAGLKSSLLPIASLVFGVIGVWVLNDLHFDIIQGLVVGLSASGLWSGTKAVVGK